MPDADKPVGIFDSGVGGISVLREIRGLLPCEDLVYVADSAHVPYGNKSPDFIRERSRKLTGFLLGAGCKAIVIACNTATASAAAALRGEFPDIPIVGMEPAVKPAVTASKVHIAGVLATVGMLQSAQFAGLLGKFAGDVRVVTQPAPGLVECVESGQLHTAETRALVRSFVRPLVDAGVDVIVLGCTHYPFLKHVIQEVAGPEIVLIETGPAVARQCQRRLTETGLLNSKTSSGTDTFFTTGDPVDAVPVISSLWGRQVEVAHCEA